MTKSANNYTLVPHGTIRSGTFQRIWTLLLFGTFSLSGYCAEAPLSTEAVSNYLTPAPPSLLNWQQQESVHMRYDLNGQMHKIPYSIAADFIWQLSPTRYKTKFEISHFLLGTRTQVSSGEISQIYGLSPNLFTDKIRSEDQVVFNRSNNLLEYSNKSPSEALETSAQDQLSVIFQLGFWVAKNSGQLAPGSKISIQLVSKKNSEKREFQFVGSESLNLPAPVGKVDAFKIIRLPRSSDDQRATVWLLKNKALTLGRLLLEDHNGDFVDQKLNRLELISGLKLDE